MSSEINEIRKRQELLRKQLESKNKKRKLLLQSVGSNETKVDAEDDDNTKLASTPLASPTLKDANQTNTSSLTSQRSEESASKTSNLDDRPSLRGDRRDEKHEHKGDFKDGKVRREEKRELKDEKRDYRDSEREREREREREKNRDRERDKEDYYRRNFGTTDPYYKYDSFPRELCRDPYFPYPMDRVYHHYDSYGYPPPRDFHGMSPPYYPDPYGMPPNYKDYPPPGYRHSQFPPPYSSREPHGVPYGYKEPGYDYPIRENRKEPTNVKSKTLQLPSKASEKIKPPKNDYSQHFVDTGQRPQNFIRDADLSDRFEEYPKLKELIHLKDELIKQKATAPMYMKAELKTLDLAKLGSKFDVILIDPPWGEYSRRSVEPIPFWTFDELMNLKVELVAENPSFIFLWCGSEEGLDQGRLLLKKWGYRRCEDICWIKTNKNLSEQHARPVRSDNKCIFHHTKEHCLMGIKGTVRRNQDGHLIHANVDTDIIISEELPKTEKPEELYHIIEHFSLGRRRLELFGTDNNIRPGWVTIGLDISTSNYNAEKYRNYFETPESHLLGTSQEIEELRPKSPTLIKNLTR